LYALIPIVVNLPPRWITGATLRKKHGIAEQREEEMRYSEV